MYITFSKNASYLSTFKLLVISIYILSQIDLNLNFQKFFPLKLLDEIQNLIL